MTVYLSSSETDESVVFQWYATEVGDIIENTSGVHSGHPTLLAIGTTRLEVSGQEPEEFQAPHIIILPLDVPYKFTVLVPGVVYCVYSKLTGAAAEMQGLVKDETIIWS